MPCRRCRAPLATEQTKKRFRSWAAREFVVGRSWVARVAERPARVADFNSRSGNSRVADPPDFEYILIYVITGWPPPRDGTQKIIVLGVYRGKGSNSAEEVSRVFQQRNSAE